VQCEQQEQRATEVALENTSKTPKHRNGQREIPVKSTSVIAIRNMKTTTSVYEAYPKLDSLQVERHECLIVRSLFPHQIDFSQATAL
jgi:hypothetical protein